jgi:predicted naringenin-chalcone synthase
LALTLQQNQMILHAVASATPPYAYTQAQCWEILQKAPSVNQLTRSARSLLEKVLLGDSGIETRHFATPTPDELLAQDAEQLNQRFEREAPILAGTALKKALAKGGTRVEELDALIICTCTGYVCPGISSYVAQQLGLRANTVLLDLVGQGCGAAIPLLRTGQALLAAGARRVACVAVEISSAAFYLENDPGVLISLCLFGDGAAAVILGPESETIPERRILVHSFDSLHLPEHRDLLRFTNAQGKLRNQLAKQVPEVAAAAVEQLWQRRAIPLPDAVIAHPGGKNVLQALQQVLPNYDFKESAAVLKHYGNMSSPSVLFALEKRLEMRSEPQQLWLTAFGAGFTCFSCTVEVV